MRGSMLIVASYVLLLIAVVAFAVRLFRILTLPVHLRWELSPVPHEKGRGHYGGSYLEEPRWWLRPRERSPTAEAWYMFKEIAFLKALWEHNRRLWWFSFPFHLGLYALALVLALVVLTGVLAVAGAAGASAALEEAVRPLAGVGYLLGTFGAAGLLSSRLLDPRLRRIASPSTWFNLVLLLAVFTSGGTAVLGTSFAANLVAVSEALLSADFGVQTPHALAVHVLLTGVFLAYLPFTSMMHPVAKYFTYHQVRWDDEPLESGGRMEKKLQELLAQPVSWAGPHVGSNGAKSWVEVATEVPSKEAGK